jgi:hypothetical protein
MASHRATEGHYKNNEGGFSVAFRSLLVSV